MDVGRLRRIADELDECAAEMNRDKIRPYTADELERAAETLRFVADDSERS